MKFEWKQILTSLLIGLFIGAIFGAWGLRYSFYKKAWHGGVHGEKKYARMLKHFSSKLDLNSEQKQRVATILEDKRQKMQTLRAEINPKFKELRDTTSAEIKNVLTPEQQKKFDLMQKRWEKRWKKHHPDNPQDNDAR